MKIQNTSLFLVAVSLCILFTTCKKYPENNLWLKNPDKVFKGGKLTAFNVDGVDSLPMWDNIYNAPPDYNGFYNPFNARSIEFSYQRKGDLLSSNIGEGSLEFNNKKKEISISFSMIANAGAHPKYNLFYTKQSNWKILMLNKKGTLKIQRIYNNKTYEIQIN